MSAADSPIGSVSSPELALSDGAVAPDVPEQAGAALAEPGIAAEPDDARAHAPALSRPRRGPAPALLSADERRARLVDIASLQAQGDLKSLQARAIATLVELIAQRASARSDRRSRHAAARRTEGDATE